MNLWSQLQGRVCYYQGLNFIAAYSMLALQDDELAFRFVLHLVETHLCRYVDTSLKQVGAVFFITERLVSEHLPALGDKFRQNEVEQSSFVTPFVLTVYSFIGQRFPDSRLLVEIWDLFLSDGWVAVYKAFVFLMKHYSPKMLSLSEEYLLMYLNALSSEEVWAGDNSPDNPQSFKQRILACEPTDAELDALALDFVLISKELNFTFASLFGGSHNF